MNVRSLFRYHPNKAKALSPSLNFRTGADRFLFKRVGAVFGGINWKCQLLQNGILMFSDCCQNHFDFSRHVIDVGHSVNRRKHTLGIVETDQW